MDGKLEMKMWNIVDIGGTLGNSIFLIFGSLVGDIENYEYSSCRKCYADWHRIAYPFIFHSKVCNTSQVLSIVFKANQQSKCAVLSSKQPTTKVI